MKPNQTHCLFAENNTIPVNIPFKISNKFLQITEVKQ